MTTYTKPPVFIPTYLVTRPDGTRYAIHANQKMVSRMRKRNIEVVPLPVDWKGKP